MIFRKETYIIVAFCVLASSNALVLPHAPHPALPSPLHFHHLGAVNWFFGCAFTGQDFLFSAALVSGDAFSFKYTENILKRLCFFMLLRAQDSWTWWRSSARFWAARFRLVLVLKLLSRIPGFHLEILSFPRWPRFFVLCGVGFRFCVFGRF